MTAPISAARLRALAGKATKGPWSLDIDRGRGYLDGIESGVTIYGGPGEGLVGYMVREAIEQDNGAFIIAADPLAVTALLDALREAREVAAEIADESSIANARDAAAKLVARMDALVEPEGREP